MSWDSVINLYAESIRESLNLDGAFGKSLDLGEVVKKLRGEIVEEDVPSREFERADLFVSHRLEVHGLENIDFRIYLDKRGIDKKEEPSGFVKRYEIGQAIGRLFLQFFKHPEDMPEEGELEENMLYHKFFDLFDGPIALTQDSCSFANSFLMPTKEFIEEVKKSGYNDGRRKKYNLAQISEMFLVPKGAVVKHFNNSRIKGTVRNY